MVMDHEKQRARYVAGTEGAPPVPPPGGYRNARRQAGPITTQVPGAPAASATATASEVSAAERKPANALGWSALIVGILFALILLITMAVGATDALYGVTMLALQLVVVAVIIGALFSSRGRRFAVIALAITLVFNVATVGGIGALQTSASGSYDGMKTDEQKHEEAYPGIKDTDPQDALNQQSLEEVRAEADALFADIRERITAEYGYEWVKVGDEDLRPERNGYGGESMLIEYSSVGWATTEPIHGYSLKLDVMNTIDQVVAEHGMPPLYSFNGEYSGLDPSVIAKLYGSEDPRKQHTWEYYTDNYPDPTRLYANIYDLSNDPTGDFLTNREAQSARTGEPLEGLQMVVIASAVLSEADRAEFEEKLKDYPGFQ
ncbi:putative integral membrane protein [Microbacterium phyllosphaerae]|uniref:Integral membrane protein n=1 Tax=Microbacterium phyllosphaerae TaxID=124798 RepID=A0ABS4WNQ3_9MICO|nr:DUF4064 domain-containing protein [Microbacterium phyllosphaerae]MBP2377169.1 putative integral membrane protein [Microbacterium phyllosphaerae]